MFSETQKRELEKGYKSLSKEQFEKVADPNFCACKIKFLIMVYRQLQLSDEHMRYLIGLDNDKGVLVWYVAYGLANGLKTEEIDELLNKGLNARQIYKGICKKLKQYGLK